MGVNASVLIVIAGVIVLLAVSIRMFLGDTRELLMELRHLVHSFRASKRMSEEKSVVGMKQINTHAQVFGSEDRLFHYNKKRLFVGMIILVSSASYFGITTWPDIKLLIDNLNEFSQIAAYKTPIIISLYVIGVALILGLSVLKGYWTNATYIALSKRGVYVHNVGMIPLERIAGFTSNEERIRYPVVHLVLLDDRVMQKELIVTKQKTLKRVQIYTFLVEGSVDIFLDALSEYVVSL